MSNAVTDIKTGKITGCKKGTFAWYHEVGHIEFDKTEWGAKRRYLQEQSLTSSVFFCVFSFFIIYFKYFALISVIAYLFLFIEEEIWCNKFAKSKLGKKVCL